MAPTTRRSLTFAGGRREANYLSLSNREKAETSRDTLSYLLMPAPVRGRSFVPYEPWQDSAFVCMAVPIVVIVVILFSRLIL